jgi:hypothetical protein
MKVWLVLFNCGDYYCGCPGGGGDQALHIFGAYTSREKAEDASPRAEAGPHGRRDTWIVEADVE